MASSTSIQRIVRLFNILYQWLKGSPHFLFYYQQLAIPESDSLQFVYCVEDEGIFGSLQQHRPSLFWKVCMEL